MSYRPDNPLIVQSDLTMLLEVDTPLYAEVRDAISPFAEIVKSPEHVHTYRISPISLWNAAATGLTPDPVIETLTKYSRYDIPANLIESIKDIMGRYGRVKIEPYDDSSLQLSTEDELLMRQLFNTDAIRKYLPERMNNRTAIFDSINRGLLKQALIKIGYPALDAAGNTTGAPVSIALKTGDVFQIRPYQIAACESFDRNRSLTGGSGVVVLPCGAGKTIVGMAVMDRIKSHTLILTTGGTAIRQWIRELSEKTSIDPDDIGEYSGEKKEIKPVTVSTYQIITYRKSRNLRFTHFDALNDRPWGLIIYDEVHLLPAQVFRFTASLQSVRRLGLTATLVREDGREDDVFSLIGPKCYDVPWRVIESQGWIAPVECSEIRVAIEGENRLEYASASSRQRFRIAAENPAKLPVIRELLNIHANDMTLVIGQYLDQLKKIAGAINAPLITGATKQAEREMLYQKFREGRIPVLVVSSVANFALDLPDASVAIQVSGRFGSRQEEAQRLGRILRPKSDGRQARFYTLVSRETEEQDYALKRQLFLTEQGYSYEIETRD